MTAHKPSKPRLGACRLTTLLLLATLQGCTVIAIADTVGTVAVKTVGLAADAAIGVVKLSGQAVGAVLPGDE